MVSSPWRQISDRRWERSDGAAVLWDDRTPHANPCLPHARMWTAWSPNPEDRCLTQGRRNSRRTWPRRFRTPENAMAAADREWPPKAVVVIEITW